MRTKNVMIIAAVVIVLLAVLTYGATSLMQLNNNTTDNNTTNDTTLNLSDNNTNNTTENQTTQTQTTKKTTQKTSSQSTSKKSSSSNNGVTYDSELNAYFDSNGRTAYEGQFPKGTSREDMKRGLAEIGADS